MVFNRTRAEIAAFRAPSQHLVERDADAAHVRRQPQNVAELAVPGDQLHVLVEDAKAVAHLIDRRLQQIAVVLNSLRRVVEQAQRRWPRHGAA